MGGGGFDFIISIIIIITCLVLFNKSFVGPLITQDHGNIFHKYHFLFIEFRKFCMSYKGLLFIIAKKITLCLLL